MVVRSKNATALVAAGAALALVLVSPIAAWAAEGQYANERSLTENQVASSAVRAAGLKGGRAWVNSTSADIFSVIQTRDGTYYNVLYSAQSNNGNWTGLTHVNVANTWSTCQWYYAPAALAGSLSMDCWRKW
jgi:hypothetical protein